MRENRAGKAEASSHARPPRTMASRRAAPIRPVAAPSAPECQPQPHQVQEHRIPEHLRDPEPDPARHHFTSTLAASPVAKYCGWYIGSTCAGLTREASGVHHLQQVRVHRAAAREVRLEQRHAIVMQLPARPPGRPPVRLLLQLVQLVLLDRTRCPAGIGILDQEISPVAPRHAEAHRDDVAAAASFHSRAAGRSTIWSPDFSGTSLKYSRLIAE